MYDIIVTTQRTGENMKKIFLICFVIVYTILHPFSTIYAKNLLEDDKEIEGKETVEQTEQVEHLYKGELWPYISAKAACVLDAKTGLLVYDKNMNHIKYPASMTKVMTALLLVEYIEENNIDLEERVTMSFEAVYGIAPDSSTIYLDVDETINLKEALFAIMIRSANEVSVSVAEYISGSEEEFAKKMTHRARELGAKHTNFVNAHGLHDNDHYTTPYDMALIMKEAITHELFKEAISTIKFDIPPTEKFEETRYLQTTNRLILDTQSVYDPTCFGGKTGFTNKAQHTLASYFIEGEKEVIVVVMEGERDGKFIDSAQLAKKAFEEYKTMTIEQKEPLQQYVSVIEDGDLIGQTYVEAKGSVEMCLPYMPEEEIIEWTLKLPEADNEYLSKEPIGVLEAWCGSILVGTTDIYRSFFLPASFNQLENMHSGIEEAIAKTTGDNRGMASKDILFDYPKPSLQVEEKSKTPLYIILGGISSGILVFLFVLIRVIYQRYEKKKRNQRPVRRAQTN